MNKSELRAALKEVEDMIDNAGDYDDIEELENERQEIMRQLRTIKSSYDSENVIFRATTRGGKNFVEVTDTGDNVDRYRITQDGAVNYEDDINAVVGNLVTQGSYGEGTFNNIEIDELGIGQEYLNILKQIKAKYGFLEKFEVASEGRQFYFRLMRYIGNNIKKGTPVEEVFRNADSIMKSYGLSNSRRPVKSSQKGMENVAENTQYDDYHVDTRGMGILDVENIIEDIESRGNQAVLTVQSSDGSVQHTYFTPDSWREYKDAKNNSRAAITDVWITEVNGGSYARN